MAGTIVADFIRTDANQLSLNVGNTTFATINASGFFSNTGTQLIAANGSLGVSSVGTNQLQSGSVTSAKIATAANTIPRSAMTAGAILQVVQVVKTDAFSGSAGATWADISGMSASITPTSASSKILVTVDLKGAAGENYSVIRSRLLRGSTAIFFGDAASARPQSMNQFYMASGGAGGGYYVAQLGGTFLDSPATTSSVTYKVQFGGDGTSQVVFINRTQGDRDGSTYDSRVPSSITLMEIAA
jgi:hypothetical protein